jgi:hypothetical protein
MAQLIKTTDKRATCMAGQPMSLSRTPSKLRWRAADLGEHTDAVLKEFGFNAPRGTPRCAKPRHRLTRRGRAETSDDDASKTARCPRKDGRVGYVIFNNPERRNAVSLDMWARTTESSRTSPATMTCAWSCSLAPAVRPRLGRRRSSLESERSSLEATRVSTRRSRRPMPASTNLLSRPSR